MTVNACRTNHQNRVKAKGGSTYAGKKKTNEPPKPTMGGGSLIGENYTNRVCTCRGGLQAKGGDQCRRAGGQIHLEKKSLEREKEKKGGCKWRELLSLRRKKRLKVMQD